MTRTLTVRAPTVAERLGGTDNPAPALIDVRAPVESEAGHISGAVNVPVCRSGRRAGQAQEALQSSGLSAATVLSGGIVDREKTGGGLVFTAVTNTRATGMALATMSWSKRGARATGSALDQLTRKR